MTICRQRLEGIQKRPSPARVWLKTRLELHQRSFRGISAPSQLGHWLRNGMADPNWEITGIGLFAEKTVLGGGLARPFCP